MGGKVASHEPQWREVPAILLSNFFVLFAWIFFRAVDFEQAGDVISGIATFQDGLLNHWDLLLVAVFTVGMVLNDLWQRRRAQAPQMAPKLPPMAEGAVIGGCLAVLALFSGGTPVPFIYFQF